MGLWIRKVKIAENRIEMCSLQKLKKSNSMFRIRPSQAILFAPAAILLSAGALVARNFCSRPVIRAQDFPQKNHEVVIYLKYSPVYPFKGGVEATLEVRQFPDHHIVCSKMIGKHRWYSEAVKSYKEIEWKRWDRIIIHSEDGSNTRSVRIGIYSNLDPLDKDPW